MHCYFLKSTKVAQKTEQALVSWRYITEAKYTLYKTLSRRN